MDEIHPREDEHRLYKVVTYQGQPVNGGSGAWSMPVRRKVGVNVGRWQAGRWTVPLKGALALCKNGYHLCSEASVRHWLNMGVDEEDAVICAARYRGGAVIEPDSQPEESDWKIAVRQAQLTRVLVGSVEWRDMARAMLLMGRDVWVHYAPQVALALTMPGSLVAGHYLLDHVVRAPVPDHPEGYDPVTDEYREDPLTVALRSLVSDFRQRVAEAQYDALGPRKIKTDILNAMRDMCRLADAVLDPRTRGYSLYIEAKERIITVAYAMPSPDTGSQTGEVMEAIEDLFSSYLAGTARPPSLSTPPSAIRVVEGASIFVDGDNAVSPAGEVPDGTH